MGNWVWRFDPKTRQCKPVADQFHRPNGLVFSPDETILYVTDTGKLTGSAVDFLAPRSIYAFDVKGRTLSNRRLLYVSDNGIPDGLKVDATGRIYTGCADGVHVISPEGDLLGKILIQGCDGGVANLCFGHGKQHCSTLFMLAEGAVISIELNTIGQPVGVER